jgi:nucleotide-binding universal stress UspA family protein
METRLIPAETLPRRVVVGLDELGLADAAAVAALALGDRLGAPVELVHAVPRLPETWPRMNVAQSVERSRAMLEAASRAAELHVVRLVDRAKPRSARPIEEMLRVVPGRASEALLSSLRPGDLAVVGARRSAGLFHFGGTIRAMLARSPCPMWVQSSPAARLERWLVAVDLSETSVHALALAVELARELRGRVTVLHVHQAVYPWTGAWGEGYAAAPLVDLQALEAATRRQLGELVERVDWRNLEHETVFVEGPPAARIVEEAREHDVLVLGTRGHGALAAALVGSVAMEVLERGEGPMLFVPHRPSEA